MMWHTATSRCTFMTTAFARGLWYTFTSGESTPRDIYLDASDGITTSVIKNWCESPEVTAFELRVPEQHNGIFNSADIELQVCELAGLITDQPNTAVFLILPPPQLWRIIRLQDTMHNALCKTMLTYPAKRPLNLYGPVEFMLETHLQLPAA